MKTYKFPALGGGQIEKTLGGSKNFRIDGALGLFGLKKYSDFFAPETMMSATIAKLDIAIDTFRLPQLFDFILMEGSEGIDFDSKEFDAEVVDEVVQDFFEQRAKKLLERTVSSLART